ncbi:uncharacterized protein EKO05_0008115 [Ascochyta rabiei]|nr:uncharacterized protein EKO05_0008115 [Ascochyta rabiei]UPX17777.1 hypothetical protein EKO05_0008115 [Ascochyta rabiei]
MNELDDNSTACAVCKTSTTNKCTGCKTHTYCSKDCQAKDWSAHKVLCKDTQLERKLARVAEVVHEAYLTFRENTWDGVITKVEDKEDALIIHDGNNWGNPQHFTAFPHDVVPNSRRAKLGVLTAWTCDEPYAFMDTLIVKLLDGLNVDMHEISVHFSHVPRKTVAVTYPTGKLQSNWPKYQHTVLRLTSRRSGKQWVMDFAGGQYGIVKPFHTWVQYKALFVQKLVSIYDMGTNKRIFAELAKIAGLPTLTYGLVGRAAAKLDQAIGTWETEHKPLLTLRGLQDVEFDRQKSSLLGAVDKAVHTFITTTDFAPVVRKAHAINTPHDRMKKKVEQLYGEANLLQRSASDKRSLTGEDGNEHSLQDFAQMARSRGLHPIVIDGSGGKATKVHHIFI